MTGDPPEPGPRPPCPFCGTPCSLEDDACSSCDQRLQGLLWHDVHPLRVPWAAMLPLGLAVSIPLVITANIARVTWEFEGVRMINGEALMSAILLLGWVILTVYVLFTLAIPVGAAVQEHQRLSPRFGFALVALWPLSALALVPVAGMFAPVLMGVILRPVYPVAGTRDPRCPSCRYDLSQAPPKLCVRCSECGTDATWRFVPAWRHQRRWILTALGAIAALAVLAVQFSLRLILGLDGGTGSWWVWILIGGGTGLVATVLLRRLHPGLETQTRPRGGMRDFVGPLLPVVSLLLLELTRGPVPW